jgi:hypothetical protein
MVRWTVRDEFDADTAEIAGTIQRLQYRIA